VDNFLFAVSPNEDGHLRFQMAFALGPLFMSMEMTYLHPKGDVFEWNALWRERADMFQYLMDLVSESELRLPSKIESLPHRPFIWQFIEAPETGPETRSLNRIFALEHSGQTLEILPLDFESGFYGLKERISAYFGGNVVSNSTALKPHMSPEVVLYPGFGYEVHASIGCETPDDLSLLLVVLADTLSSLTPNTASEDVKIGENFELGWNLRPGLGIKTGMYLAPLTPPTSPPRTWSLRFWFEYRSEEDYLQTLAQFVPMAQTLPWDLITDRDEGQVWAPDGQSVGQWLVLRQK
jgi:hypothetical protein